MSDTTRANRDLPTRRLRPVEPAPEPPPAPSTPPAAPRRVDRTTSLRPASPQRPDASDGPDSASLMVAEFYHDRRLARLPAPHVDPLFPTDHDASSTSACQRRGIADSLAGDSLGMGCAGRPPAVGDEIFGFRLRQPLGSGAFAQVFVAEQSDLAGRPVVLKISAIEGTEPQTLARLQHTNIVPIHSVHEDPRRFLRAVCMPYLGGASLSAVLDRLWEETDCPTRGEQFVRALESIGQPETSSPAEAPSTPVQTPLHMMRGQTYLKTVAWIVAQIADGLQHAHQRGVYHRDVKPSNILISAEGQPLLLDFNVAQETFENPAHAILGGTVAYAAPEHLLALIERTPELIQCVDRRSDVYSLGLVLAEMLTNQRIFEQAGSYSALPTQIEAMASERARSSPSLRQIRPDIPWSLESISRKCLAPNPDQRYQSGEELAEDLRRFLDDRPLKFAPELSRVERFQKFLRRHPQLATSGPAAAVGAALLLGMGWGFTAARNHLADARARERKQAHDEGTTRALCLVNTVLGRQDHLRQGVNVCEDTLALYKLPANRPLSEHPDWLRLSPQQRRQVADDQRELTLLLAGARVRLAKGDPAVVRQAIAALDDAEKLPCAEPSKALWVERAADWDLLGDATKADLARRRAESVEPTTAREFYLLAISQARQGGVEGYARAINSLDRALKLNPRHYWSTLQRGICRMELGQSSQAIGDFGACIGLWPDHPWGYFNRGYLLDRGGMKAAAVADYSSAVQLDPAFVEARANRGLARLELRLYPEALADFDRVLAVDPKDAASTAGRAIALEAIGRHAEADASFGSALELLKSDRAAVNRLLWSFGFASSSRRPETARAAFDRVLSDDSRHPQALYGRAMLAMSAGDLDEALTFFDRALAADPNFHQARRYRAIVHARRRAWDRASQDINLCLEREPGSGDTLYAAACVASHAAGAAASDSARDQAFDLLSRARAVGAGAEAATDPDLETLRNDPRFGRFVDSAAVARDPSAPEANRPQGDRATAAPSSYR